MRVDGVVVRDPAGQLVEHGSGVGFGADADVVALEGTHEGPRHAVALRPLDWRGARDQAHVPGEAAGLARGEAGAVIGQPFNRARQSIHLTEAVLDAGHHEFLHVIRADA